jgi:hypothetical protein
MVHAVTCPQCNAPLTPHPFARSIVCSYCGNTVRFDESSVSAVGFREAFRIWNAPQAYQFSSWISIGEKHWAIDKCIAHGDISDVYIGQRARWPSELVVMKLLRDSNDMSLVNNEWETLQKLHRSQAPGADTFVMRIPQPVMHGNITAGPHPGKHVSIFRWTSGFYHNFEKILQVYPQGIPPIASIWIWRRILEVLSFIHNSGMVHGAVLPSHLLVQENEHGVLLVGYSAAGRSGEKLHMKAHRFEAFYPQSKRSELKLTTQLDIIMSARVMVATLGGDPETGVLPATVPKRLAGVIQRIARANITSSVKENAWSIREELGAISSEVFGPPQFVPIMMPS